MATASFAPPDAFGGTVTVSLTEALPPGASGPMLVGAANVGPRIRTHRDREDADGPKTLIADFSEIRSRPATLEATCLFLTTGRFC